MKIIDIPQSGKLGTFISFRTRHGQVRRPYKVPRDPRNLSQLIVRGQFGRPPSRWRTLTPNQRAAWRSRAESPAGGYNLFVQISANLAFAGEPQVADPPDRPIFSNNPVGDLAITNTGGVIALKFPVPTAPARCTSYGAPRRAAPGCPSPRASFVLASSPTRSPASATSLPCMWPNTACLRSTRKSSLKPSSKSTAGKTSRNEPPSSFPPLEPSP